MTEIPFILAKDVEHLLSWTGIANALDAGHKLARAQIDDLLLQRTPDAMLNRASWIDGMGLAIKSATIFPENNKQDPPLPSIHAVVVLFDDTNGRPRAVIDGDLVTKWKTAGDSMLGARYLAPSDPKNLTIIGAGVVARSLVDAYSEVFPSLENITVWNRTHANAEALVEDAKAAGFPVSATTDLETAVGSADIVSSATMSTSPFIRGDWISPGTHIDLIGAFKPDMREADDALIGRASLFVDSRSTAVHDIGELAIPLKAGIISETDVKADFYDLSGGQPGRSNESEVTLFKNGGGAHLDLMTATMIYDVYSAQ